MGARVVVVAPDKFKGTLTAVEAAERIGAGIARARPGVRVVLLPVADGGEGTVDAAVAAGFTRVPMTVAGPTGEPVAAALAVRDGTAVVEAAQAAGLARLPGGRAAPLVADSTGCGELIAGALELGVTRLVLGLGGVASTDGGSGMARALGVEVTDDGGRAPGRGGAALVGTSRVRVPSLTAERLRGVEVVVACDVDNPLLGPSGAAAVYAPQKGATAGDVEVLERGLRTWADVVARDVPGAAGLASAPGAGAAGGLGFGALAFLGARLRPGIGLMLELVGFDDTVAGAELVVTGEGSLDSQSLHGKAPVGVARAARAKGVRAAAVCGRLRLDREGWSGAGFDAVYALDSLGQDSVGRAGELAELSGVLLAQELLDP